MSTALACKGFADRAANEPFSSHHNTAIMTIMIIDNQHH